MAVIPLLRPSAEARALLHHILQHGDIMGNDIRGRTIIQLAVDERTLERLMTFDADAAELEGDADDEEDGPPVLVDLVRPKLITLKEPRRAGPGTAERSRPRLATPATPPLAFVYAGPARSWSRTGRSIRMRPSG
jgi:hypothetical protein